MFNFSPVAPCILLAYACLLSCAPMAYRYASPTPAEPITESLFDYKDRTISEVDIPRLLDGHIQIRDTIRLAIFPYSGARARPTYWYDEDNLQTQQAWFDTLTDAIKGAPRVQKIILLPAMITGDHPNIHQLRESAVRLQADMLLVYSLNSDLFQKYRAFQKDEVRAFATCEALLMDIRTGVIPFTYIATKSAQIQKEKADFGAGELNKRAQDLAILQAMLDMGQQLAGFLSAE